VSVEITEKGSGRRWQRTVFLAVSAAIVVGVIVVAHAVMLPFVLALLIAYLLAPLVAWVEAKRMPRGAAILLVYVVVLGAISLFVRATAPRVGQELGGLRHELPAMLDRARDEWIPEGNAKLRDLGLLPPEPPRNVSVREEGSTLIAVPRADGSLAIDLKGGVVVKPTHGGEFVIESAKEDGKEAFDPNRVLRDALGKSVSYVQHNAVELARLGRDIVAGISRVFFIFGITLMLAAYIMLTREKIFGFFASLLRPSARGDFDLLLWRIDRGLAGVVRGQLIICLVNGVLSAIGFALVGLKYWPVLAIVATVFSLIPIFGSIISAVPAVALGLTQGFGTALFVLLWIIGIHQLEANFLNPKIMGDAAKIHPVLVIFSLLVGEHFFHTVGALLAVPCMSIAQSFFIHFRMVVQRHDPELAHEAVASMPPPAGGSDEAEAPKSA